MEEENKKVYENADEALAKFEEVRRKSLVPAMILMIFGAVGIVASLIVIIAFAGQEIVYIATIALFMCCGIIAIGYFLNRSRSRKVKAEIASFLLTNEYPSSKFELKGGEPIETIMKCGFFPRPDRHEIYNHLIAEYGGVKISCCDFEFERREHDSRGNTSYRVIAKGRFYNFDFKRDFKETVKVCEKSFLSGVTIDSSLKKVETESIDFNKKFKIWASDPLTAFYILTPQIQLAILDLEKSVKGQFYMSFMNGNLYIALNNCGDTFPIKTFKPFTMKSFEPILINLRFPKVIIDSLKLSGSKYTTDLEYTSSSRKNK